MHIYFVVINPQRIMLNYLHGSFFQEYFISLNYSEFLFPAMQIRFEIFSRLCDFYLYEIRSKSSEAFRLRNATVICAR